MNMRALRLFAGFAAVLLSPTAHAQMGIRYGLQYESVTTAKFGSNRFVLLGWDFDHNDRLSGGLDLSMDMNWSGEFNMPESATSGQYFAEKVKIFGVQYRSQFHFSDNGGGSFYLGSMVGLRMVAHKINYYANDNNGYYSYSGKLVESRENGVLIPFGLRAGVRSPLEGGYWDLYLGVGTNVGSNGTPVNDLPFLADESVPNAVFVQAGLCFGIGW